MYIDLDNFKNINNTYGKKFGDQYLIEISHRLQNIITIDDFLCRMSGDEFLLIFNSLLNNDDANIIANEIQELIKNPFFNRGQIISLTASIGIASYPEDGYNFDSVMKNADIAMYYAKQNGRDDFHLYNKEINETFFDPLSLISDMRSAIDKNQFHLTYQPKILLSDNSVVGAEALLRWNHPIHGLISPEIFIPIAEKSGLIIEIGNWVIEQSCIACNNWKRAGFPHISVAINISTIQFNDKNIVERIKENITNTKVNPENIEFEITESLLLHDTSDFRDTLDQIKKLGIKVSIDDFGTGYSNLEYLKTIDVDILKIDRSFVQNLKNEKHNKNIIKAIVEISNSLNIKVIAEGIETEESVNSLKAIGCQIGQGYFWAKPIIEEKFLAFLSNSKTGILIEQ
jgi:diguanylate cyclase (GGDEF)-like protein